jgi:hypothetical protein
VAFYFGMSDASLLARAKYQNKKPFAVRQMAVLTCITGLKGSTKLIPLHRGKWQCLLAGFLFKKV